MKARTAEYRLAAASKCLILGSHFSSYMADTKTEEGALHSFTATSSHSWRVSPKVRGRTLSLEKKRLFVAEGLVLFRDLCLLHFWQSFSSPLTLSAVAAGVQRFHLRCEPGMQQHWGTRDTEPCPRSRLRIAEGEISFRVDKYYSIQGTALNRILELCLAKNPLSPPGCPEVVILGHFFSVWICSFLDNIPVFSSVNNVPLQSTSLNLC